MFVELQGTARLDKRTKRLVKRLGPDDIAIIDHAGLARVAAEELLESGVRVVVNVAPSLTGRFPNPGPLQLVRGGVTLIDVADNGLFGDVREGESLVVRGSSLYRNGTRLAAGRELTTEELERGLEEQQERLAEALEGFAENTMRFLKQDGTLLAEDLRLPQLRARPRVQERPAHGAALRAR